MNRIPSEQRGDQSASSNLLSRVQASDAQAWRRFTVLYSPWLYGIARRAGLGEADAADISQEVFMTAAVKIESFRRDETGQSMRRWLGSIARNKIGDWLRLQRNRPMHLDDSMPPVSVDDSLAQLDSSVADERPLIRQAIELVRTDFSESTWLCFRRSVLEDRSAAEIAEDLGMTPKAVRQARYRVLRRLREEFEGLIHTRRFSETSPLSRGALAISESDGRKEA